MKKFFLFFFFLFLLPRFALAADEAINDFTVNIKINKDGSINVTEKILYDFGSAEKHGIYRDITYKYQLASGKYKLRLSEVMVTDSEGKPYIFKVSNNGNYKRIKIGDPNKTITGIHFYQIQYQVKRAINFFPNHDELYWNATGNNWSVLIKQIKTEIILPQALSEKEITTKCFSGPAASSGECLSNRYLYTDSNLVNSAVFISDRLEPGEGQTIVVGLPKGIIKQPSNLLLTIETIKDNWIIMLPLLVLFGMFYLWRKIGRDPKNRMTIISEFEAPDNLTPAEIGTIIDERAQNKDISAEIINLAVKGYLKISYKEGQGLKAPDYQIDKLKEADNLLPEIEKDILAALFKNKKNSVTLSDLKYNFFQDLEEIKKKIYSILITKGYFNFNPKLIRVLYIIAGFIICSIGIFTFNIFGWLGTVSFLLSGLIIIIFSFFMPKKTKTGAMLKERILGLRLYLSVAEKDRINFHNAPEKKPQHFEKLLPYAMVLGVEKEWAKQFVDIYKESPSWYSGPAVVFTPVFFVKDLNSFSGMVNSSLSSAAGGGSGFSGGSVSGGFGGGGGGSW